MGKKGHKSKLGHGELWNEPKDRLVTIKLTMTGRRLLDEYAQKLNISRGELIERFARGLVEPPDKYTESAPNTAEIIERLPAFSFQELIGIGKEILDLISSYESPGALISIASLVNEWEPQALAEEACLKLEEVEMLSKGSCPTDEQIIGLSRAMNIDPEKLLAVRRKVFGNDSEPRSSMVY